MKFVFLVEDGAQDPFSLSALWTSSSVYIAPLAELAKIDGQLVCSRPDKSLGTLVNGFVLGVIAKSGPDGEVDATLRRSIEAIVPPAFHDDLFFVVDPSAQQLGDLILWLMKRYQLYTGKFAQFSAQSDLNLAEMRNLFLDAQSALKSAEHELARVPMISHKLLLLEHIQGSDTFQQVPRAIDDASFSLSQRSLHHLKSLKRVDLRFQPRPILQAGVLHVEARGAFSGKILGAWKRPRARLVPGWNEFMCRSETNLHEPVEIRIAWRSDSEPPSLGMGVPVGDTTAAAKLASGKYLERPFALRLWRSEFLSSADIAGETGPADADETEADEALSSVYVASNLLPTGVFYSGPPQAPPTHVGWRSNEAGLIVHPAGTRPMIAIIRDVEVVELKLIAAKVRLAHPEGSPTEFALVALPQSSEAERATSRWAIAGLLGSGKRIDLSEQLTQRARWLCLSGNGRGEVIFEFAQPYTGMVDLFLMTRNPQPDSANSWAFFDELSFEGEYQ